MNDILELFKIAGKIDLNGVDKANKDLDNLDGKSKGLGSKLGGFAKKVAKGGAIVGGAMAAAGTATFAATKKVTNSFDDIAKSSTKLGVSTDAYQELDYWAGQNGISHEQMEKAVGRFNQRMGQATNGNEKYAGALQRLGVDMEAVKNGTLSTEDAFAQSIQKLSEMESETDKVDLATEMFGTRMARDLMPALQDGSLSLEDAKKKAQELGIVIEEDTLNAAEHFNDTWDDLTRMMGAFGQKVIAQLMPAFQTMMDWVIEHMPQIQAIFETAFDIIGVVFGTAIEWVQKLIALLGEWFTSNEETMTGIWTTIQEIFTQIVEFLQEAWEFIRTLWEEHGEAILQNAITVFENVWETVETAFNAIQEIIQTVLDEVVPFIQKQLDKIMKFWDENGEQIMQAVENAFSFIQGIIEFVMPIVQGIIETAWGFIQTIFDTAIGIIMGLVKTFSSLLTGDFEGIKEGLTKIWDSLWDGIKGIVEGAWDLLSGAFSALWDNISDWFTGLKDDAVDWGKNMIDGFIDGIKGMGEKVANAASDVVNKAGDFLKFWSPAKKGEGRYIRHWGRNMIDGFLDGVRDEEDSAGRAMEKVVKKMNPGTLNVDAMATVGGRGVVKHDAPRNQTNNKNNNITINNTFTTKEMTPSETTRSQKRMLQNMVMEGRF